MGKQWPAAVKMAPPQQTMKCETHGDEAKVRRVPDHYSTETITTLSGGIWGCADCVREVGQALAEADRKEREEKERALEEKRAAKRKLVEDARSAEDQLRVAVADFEAVSELPSLSSLQQHLETVKKKRDAALEKLRSAQDKVHEHAKKIQEIEASIANRGESQDEVRGRLATAYEESDAAWSNVSRIKRDKIRDKVLRATARKYIG